MIDVPPTLPEIEKRNRTKEILVVSGLSLLYLLLFQWLIGVKGDHLLIVISFNFLYYFSDKTRKFILAYSVFLVYWIIFDSMKGFPNYLFREVHIQDLYDLEKSWFGIMEGGSVLTANEYLLRHLSPFWDVATGLFYLCWMPVPLGFGFYLYLKHREAFLHFSFAFFFVNMLGFTIYYTFPAAPPWYVQDHGFLFQLGVKGSEAGLSRFDAFFGFDLFKAIYSKSSNVFAALPSLHSAYPIIVLFYGLKNRVGKANVFFAIVTVGIWFAAVYSSHHYVIDVLLGITCACVGLFLFERGVMKLPVFQRLVGKYSKAVA